MAFTYGFYNSLNGDRKYNAEQMAAVFDCLINDGVQMNIGNKMMVSPATVSPGLGIVVGSGRAWFNSTWSFNDSDYPFILDPVDTTGYSRIDAVCLVVNKAIDSRRNYLTIIKGTAGTSPAKPTITSTTDCFYHVLGYVTVAADVTAIQTKDIENRVGTSDCPFITGVLETVTADELLEQWEGEFYTWWEHLKLTLDENIAARLQNEIEHLSVTEATMNLYGFTHNEDEPGDYDYKEYPIDAILNQINILLNTQNQDYEDKFKNTVYYTRMKVTDGSNLYIGESGASTSWNFGAAQNSYIYVTVYNKIRYLGNNYWELYDKFDYLNQRSQDYASDATGFLNRYRGKYIAVSTSSSYNEATLRLQDNQASSEQFNTGFMILNGTFYDNYYYYVRYIGNNTTAQSYINSNTYGITFNNIRVLQHQVTHNPTLPTVVSSKTNEYPNDNVDDANTYFYGSTGNIVNKLKDIVGIGYMKRSGTNTKFWQVIFTQAPRLVIYTCNPMGVNNNVGNNGITGWSGANFGQSGGSIVNLILIPGNYYISWSDNYYITLAGKTLRVYAQGWNQTNGDRGINISGYTYGIIYFY